MGFLARMGHGVVHSPKSAIHPGHGVHGHGVLGFLVDKGERYAATAAFGYAKGYYRERFLWKGYGADVWLGAAFTLAGAVLNARSGGNSKAGQHFERIGDAGIQAAIHSWTVGKGTEHAGRVVAVTEQGKNLSGKSSTVLGAIPEAKGGDYLTADEIAYFSSPRR